MLVQNLQGEEINIYTLKIRIKWCFENLLHVSTHGRFGDLEEDKINIHIQMILVILVSSPW